MVKGHFIDGKWHSGPVAKPNIHPYALFDAIEFVEGSAKKVAQAITAGLIMISAATSRSRYHVPFRAVKGSNDGPREHRLYAREFYPTVKTVYVP